MAHTPTTPTLVIRIVLAESTSYRGDPIGTFRATVEADDPSAGYDAAPFTSMYWSEHPYAGLALEASYGVPTLADGGVYGQHVGYKAGYGLTELAKAERMVTGLRKIGKAYAARCKDNGSPQGLGQWVLYCMHALGAQHAYVKLPEGQPGYQYRDYRRLERGDDLRAYLDSRVADLRDRAPAQTSAA
jgi:hypothetical protein